MNPTRFRPRNHVACAITALAFLWLDGICFAQDIASPSETPELGGAADSMMVTPTTEPKQTSAADSISFSHSLSINSISFLPSTLAFVNTSDEAVETVRAFLTVDGALLILPLRYHAPSQAYRGTFPTPASTASYRFQITFKSGRSILTENFSMPMSCGDPFVATQIDGPIAQALAIQREEQQLQGLLDTLKQVVK